MLLRFFCAQFAAPPGCVARLSGKFSPRAARAARLLLSVARALHGARTHLRPPLEKFSFSARCARGDVASQRCPYIGCAPTSVHCLRNFLRVLRARRGCFSAFSAHGARTQLRPPLQFSARHPRFSAPPAHRARTHLRLSLEKFSPRARGCFSAFPAYGARTQLRLPPETFFFSARCARGKVSSQHSPHMGRAPTPVGRLKNFLRALRARQVPPRARTHLLSPVEKFSPRAARAASFLPGVPRT